MSVFPPAAFRFTVQIAGSPEPDDATFQEVSGISPELDAEIPREGGENRSVHALPKAAAHPRLVLKRGIADQRSPLVRWCEAVLEAGLSQPIETRDVTLRLLDETGAPLRAWSFRDAYPVRWTVDSFEGDKARLAIETIELAYSTR
jgi:phage tail-like protein